MPSCRRWSGSRPPLTPAVVAAQAAFPLRDLLTISDSYPLIVHRQQRAVQRLV